MTSNKKKTHLFEWQLPPTFNDHSMNVDEDMFTWRIFPLFFDTDINHSIQTKFGYTIVYLIYIYVYTMYIITYLILYSIYYVQRQHWTITWILFWCSKIINHIFGYLVTLFPTFFPISLCTSMLSISILGCSQVEWVYKVNVATLFTTINIYKWSLYV